jgi:outer membrane protein OmpA-like peptidoglycan-associated protein
MMKLATNGAILALVAATALAGCAQVNKQVQRVTHRGQVVAQPTCQDFTIPIYFETGSDRLTREAVQAINDHSAQIGACKVAEVAVTGLADAEGSAERNLELSRRRAIAVTQALSTRGFPTPRFEVAAGGETGASGPAGAVTPLRRRAEVNVRFASAKPGT